ncbi:MULTISPECIES: TerC family protein [Asticcacaulis]|uniref:TerC family protein n=1 Tax=Asticcacaulis TaxID=76890 RepID=UPI001AE97564|nr:MULTISPECIES: TerC family protein [Asticcacaulis]MBP2158150.1 tellurite resistance protein TerC [Asticcacaulis solisilvae]MDR6799195.1 tellurite resistance protein TerC [Asticcacaulis sp. BE141]
MLSVGTPLLWSLFGGFVVVALILDFFAMNKQGAHKVSIGEALLWTLVWVAASFAFVAFLWWQLGGLGPDPAAQALAKTKAIEFVTGYLVEKALAVDNIFVFLMLFTYFAVPPEFQKRALMIGILAALVLRGALILVGAWLISEFHWVLYVFGAFLVFTGLKMWLAAGKEAELDDNPALKWVRRSFKISPSYDGEKFFTRFNGKSMATPLLVVVLLIGIVDVVFAVDSIPAIFAITTDPFIVLTSNVFAILGLRAMYFLLAGVHEKFHLLPYGLSLVLVLIGAKMLMIDFYKIPVEWSLGATGIILVITMILSLLIKPKSSTPRGAFPFEGKDPEKTPDQH